MSITNRWLLKWFFFVVRFPKHFCFYHRHLQIYPLVVTKCAYYWRVHAETHGFSKLIFETDSKTLSLLVWFILTDTRMELQTVLQSLLFLCFMLIFPFTYVPLFAYDALMHHVYEHVWSIIQLDVCIRILRQNSTVQQKLN